MRDTIDELREDIEDRQDDSGGLHTRMRILNASGARPMLMGQRTAFPVDGESLMAGGR